MQKAILIVDDNPFNRELIAAACQSISCPCEEAENGRDALNKLKTSEFALIFMDLLMPGIDGFETIRQIRAMGVATPIIALSALSMKQDRERALEMGCDDFVSKPVELDKLRSIILDRLALQKDAGAPASPGAQAPPRQAFDFSTYRMLFVEEDAQRAARHVSFMRGLGFTVRHVANGNEALQLLRENPGLVDIIISSLFTTGIDAMGILAMVRRQHPGVLVFIYAEHYDPDTFQHAMQQGADGMFPESMLEGSALGMIESALYRRGQEPGLKNADLPGQLRQAQLHLISFGCDQPCQYCDVAFKSLHEAGGDMVRCRKFNRAGRCGIVLADVAGHDLISSYMSAVFLGILTSCWDTCQQPAELLQVVNTEFNKLGYVKSHVCVTALLWDGVRRRMQIATAGNPGPLLYERGPDSLFSCREIDGGGMCLGLLKENFFMNAVTIDCPAESQLFIFSDGVEKEDIQAAVAADPGLLAAGSNRGLSQRILDRSLPASRQQDDVVLFSYYLPPPKPSRDAVFSFLSSYKGVDRACMWAAGVLVPEKIPRGRDVDLIMLAFREGLLNAVEHGNRRNPEAFVDIMIRSSADELTIEISDQGPGFDLDQCLADALSGDQIGKRGLPAMRRVADILEVDGGTVIMVLKKE